MVEILTIALLGRHVLRCTKHLTGSREPTGIEAAGDAKVEHLDDRAHPHLLDEDVVRFEIAMANAMEETKRIADHITLSNDHDGVAVAIERFALGCFSEA